MEDILINSTAPFDVSGGLQPPKNDIFLSDFLDREPALGAALIAGATKSELEQLLVLSTREASNLGSEVDRDFPLAQNVGVFSNGVLSSNLYSRRQIATANAVTNDSGNDPITGSSQTGVLTQTTLSFQSDSVQLSSPPSTPPPPDNTLGAATNLGTLNGTTTSNNFVGSSDTNDYYRFSLGATSNFNLSLSGLSADADVEVIRDANSNGVVDAGEVIRSSTNGSTTAESINLPGLGAGSYYVRVYQYSGDTNYTLSLTGTSGLGRPTEPNNSLGTAYDISTLNGTRIFNDAVSSSDTNDFYRFSLDTTSNFGLTLNGLTADADVQVIRDANFNGVVDTGEVIRSSTAGGTTAESINLQGLAAGSYYVRVYQYSGDTNYTLSLTGTPGVGRPTEPNNSLGTAYDISTLNATRIFSDAVSSSDTNDFYRFSLGTTSNFSLTLNGLTADADVQVIRDANFNGVVDADDVIRSSTAGGTTAESINLGGLAAGTYYVRVYPFSSANTNYTLSLTGTPTNPGFTSFGVSDASGDNSANTVFQGGALRFNYNLAASQSVSSVRLEAVSYGNVVATLGTWSGASLSNALINLANFSSLTGGDYQLRAVGRTTSGQEFLSPFQSMRVLSWGRTNGTFAGETLNYSAGLGTGAVFLGRGGTDTLNLSGVARSSITSINGISLASFNPLSGSTANQAIFRGTAFDYLNLSDGREIYFQGIENLRFSDNSTLQLQVRPNDTHFGSQWNLHISDVDSAWRFTQGASNVLLASLDTGILTATGASGGIVDISTTRLITDSTDDDNFRDYGHGHSAISIMASTANNSSGVAGINWNSNVYVNDVYSGVSLQQAIRDTITYARARNQRVVFQGGIQGEFWLTSGGTQAQLEQLIRDNSDIAIFAVAAGNGNTSVNNSDPNHPSVQASLSGGVARLQNTHSNVMSIGALTRTGTVTVNGLTNASNVDRASYSNFGPGLTLMAATDSPAMDKFGNMRFFGGTSAANPNMAGIASLVWSVNPTLNGGQLRQILIDTAMDLGTTGRDDTFGNGLVNADAAVRRAWALQRNSALANLYSGSSLLV